MVGQLPGDQVQQETRDQGSGQRFGFLEIFSPRAWSYGLVGNDLQYYPYLRTIIFILYWPLHGNHLLPDPVELQTGSGQERGPGDPDGPRGGAP